MISKKVSAFTLTEMLIVLVISTIVAGLAFTIISLFGRNIHAIEKNYNGATQVHLFEQQIALDFNRYHTIDYDKQKEELRFKTPLDSVLYKFEDTYILRNSDTLLFQKTFKKVYFSGKEIKEGLVDAIEFKFIENQKKTTVFIYKENDATLYLNK